jgi:DNA polymerase-3 subunit epsilon
MKLVAIDFETAEYAAESACAVALVAVVDGKISAKKSALIRPPRSKFVFSRIHGITWDDVKNGPDFDEVWAAFGHVHADADFFVAHNASFDKRVLDACLTRARKKKSSVPFACTMKVARRQWDIRPTSLPHVCSKLKISLKHHDAESDALASASIAMRAINEGFSIADALLGTR